MIVLRAGLGGAAQAPIAAGRPRDERLHRLQRRELYLFWKICLSWGSLPARLGDTGSTVKKSSLASLCAGLLVAAALVACSSSNAAWQKASAQGTIAAYRGFIRLHPDDSRVQQARNRIDALEDARAWRAAKKVGTESAYRQYLARYPAGAYTAQAQDAITALKDSSAWRTARTAGTLTSYRTFLQRFPGAPEASRAQARLDKLAGFQVQLGRYGTASAANAAARRLKTRFGSLLGTIRIVPPGGAIKVTTIRSEQMSRPAALALCAKLRRAGQRCSVVPIPSSSSGLTLSGL